MEVHVSTRLAVGSDHLAGIPEPYLQTQQLTVVSGGHARTHNNSQAPIHTLPQ